MPTNREGKWMAVSEGKDEPSYVLSWDQGEYIDRLTMSGDRQKLAGTNQNGRVILADRAEWPKPASSIVGQRKSIENQTVEVHKSGTARADQINLTGTWHEPTGAYSGEVRQVGDEVWWILKSGEDGQLFTAVFHGRIHGTTLAGQFVDLPPGRNRLHGDIKAELVVGDGKVVAIRGDVMFPPSNDGPRLLLHRGKPGER
jgi:hypothetical protein